MAVHGNAYLRAIMDAIPIPVFVVDEDVRIVDLNRTASALLGNREQVYKQRGGDVLHCLHRHDVQEGCGRAPSCKCCVIRSSVNRCLAGHEASRRRMKLETLQNSTRKDQELLITASPLSGEERLALLMVEDISEITTLKQLIPICMSCKRIRNDEKYWEDVASYFHEYVGVEFTHGICPQCAQELYREYLKPKGTE